MCTDDFKLNITLEAYSTYYWLPPIIREFNEKYPDISVNLNLQRPTAPTFSLENEKIDYAIMVYRPSQEKYESFPLFSDELVVLVNRKHHFNQFDYIEIEDLTSEIIYTHSKPSEENKILEKTYQDAQIRAKRFVCIRHTQTILEMIEQNLGVAVLSKWAIEPYIVKKELKQIRLGRQGTYKNWFLVYLKEKPQQKFELEFISILRNYFKIYSPF